MRIRSARCRKRSEEQRRDAGDARRRRRVDAARSNLPQQGEEDARLLELEADKEVRKAQETDE